MMVIGYGRQVANPGQSELEWIYNLSASCEMQRDGIRMVLSVLIYWIWRARNEKIFSGRSFTVSALVHVL